MIASASSSSGHRKKRRRFSNDATDAAAAGSSSLNSSGRNMDGCKLRKCGNDTNSNSSRANSRCSNFSHMLKGGESDRVPTLFDMAAKATAKYVTFQKLEEKYNGRIPDMVQRRVLFWAFPRNEKPLRLYSCASSDDAEEAANKNGYSNSNYTEGLRLMENNCVEDTLQIGFYLSGIVRSTVTIDGERRAFRVSMSFDRCKITAVKCNCDHKEVYWCQHVVALALFRIQFPERVKICLPISESLNQMDRQQLQKFAQYLISRHYTDVLPTAQHLADEVLTTNSEINAIHGAPDPTAGPPDDDLDANHWFLDDTRMQISIRFCLSHITTSTDQFRQLFSKVKAMLKHGDSNGPRLLKLITEQFLEHPWSGSVLATGPAYLSPAVREKCQDMWDQLGALWVCVLLKPSAAEAQREEWLGLLCKWTWSPSCPAENAFCLPNDMFCNAHGNQGVCQGVDPVKPRTVFHRAIQACSKFQGSNGVREISEREKFGDVDDQHGTNLDLFPWSCARVDSLRTHGYAWEAVKLAMEIVRNIKWIPAQNKQDRWLGHFLDPVNIIFDCLMDAPAECEQAMDDSTLSLCRDMAMRVALLALSQRRQTPTTCVYFRQKMTKQEEALLGKLKKVKVDDVLLRTIRNGVSMIFSNQHERNGTSTSVIPNSPTIPTHSLASYLFQVFLPCDPDLAYDVGLQALQLQTADENGQSDELDPFVSRSWRAIEACGKTGTESCKCSLALSLLMAAKDDVWRLKNILKVIRSNVRSAVWIYRLAQDVQREAQVQPDGSSTKTNLLSSAFELGLRALRMVGNTNASWFRKDMIRWSVSCASMLGHDAMISLVDNWAQLFSPLEAAGTVGPMVWRDAISLQFKCDSGMREALAKAIHRMAWECASKCPSSCALPALNLCENDAVSFESTYLLLLEAGKSGRMTAEELFSMGHYLERLSLMDKAYQTALLALGNGWIGHSDEGSPLVGEVYWTCALAHSLGSLQMSAVIGLIVDRVHCPTVLADVLRRCAFPPGAFAHHALTTTPTPTPIMAVVASHPDLRRLLSAAMKAYADTVRARLCHISPRHYGEFLEFLLKAREIFALHEDGYHLFQLMLNQVKSGYKGKKKLVALIEQKFLV